MTKFIYVMFLQNAGVYPIVPVARLLTVFLASVESRNGLAGT